MSRFVSDSIITFALSMVNRGLGIGVGIVLARYLGPEGKGYLAYAPVILELVVTAVNGVAQAATYQFGRIGIPGGAVYGALKRNIAVFALPCAAVIALVACLVPSQAVLFATAVALPFAVYVQAVSGILVAADRFSATNVQRFIITTAGNAITVLVVMVLHADFRVVLAVWVLCYVGAAVYSAVAIRPFVADRTPTTSAIMREQVLFGGKAGAAQLAGYVNMRIDVVIVSAMLGATALGTYTLAVVVAELLWQLSQPVCWAAFARIAVGTVDETAAFTAKLIRHVLALVLPASILFFVAGPWLIVHVYGDAFAESAGALRWILPGVVAYAIEIPLGYYLLVRLARPTTILVIQSLSVLVCAALTIATVPTWGISGAAFATSITYCAVVLVKAWIFSRATGLDPRAFLLIRREDFHVLHRLRSKLRCASLQLVSFYHAKVGFKTGNS